MKFLALLIFVVLTSVILLYFGVLKFPFQNATEKMESPLPDLLTKVFPKAQGSENVWKPILTPKESNTQDPIFNSLAIGAYDITTNKFLFSKNVKKRLPIASLTKIMTAIIALENESIDKKITISKHAATIGEDSMGLTQNEELSLHDLMYGLILNSGNDAAEAIAESSQFGRDNFVYLMNKKAEELGLTDTHFTNPTGLAGDGNQYSTVYDLLTIARYALLNPTFAEIAQTYQYDIPLNDFHKEYALYNETNLLTSYPGVKGIKTGYTDEAGMCLVTYLDYDGHKIIAVLLNADNRREEMKNLLDYSLKEEGVKPPPHS